MVMCSSSRPIGSARPPRLLPPLASSSPRRRAHCLASARLDGGGSNGGGGGSPWSSHLLLYTTEGGGAYALDPRSSKRAWSFSHKKPLGLMQHHVSDAHGNWLLFGSSTGHCVLWDVRYGFELHSWQLPGAPKIRSMLHVRPNNTPRPIVFMGVDENVISGWEVSETPRCALLLQSAETSDAAATLAAGPPSPPMTTLKAAVSNGTHAARTLLGPLDGSCVLSGGSDMRLRCWRLLPGEASKSFTLGVPPPPTATGGADAAAPAFAEHSLPNGCRLVREAARGGVGGAEAAGDAEQAAAPKPPGGSVGAEDKGCMAAVTCAAFCGLPQPGRGVELTRRARSMPLPTSTGR